MNDPLAVEILPFTPKGVKEAIKKKGEEIIPICHSILTEIAATDNRLEARLVKTYRRGEKFTPCLAFVSDDGSIDDSNPMTLYIRPGLRNYNQGLNPEREYDKLFIASGLITTAAYAKGGDTYRDIEQCINVVRRVRRALQEQFGGMKLLDRRLKCVLCGNWVLAPSADSSDYRCPKDGINPPMWLAVDSSPKPGPPAAGNRAPRPKGGPPVRPNTASSELAKTG